MLDALRKAVLLLPPVNEAVLKVHIEKFSHPNFIGIIYMYIIYLYLFIFVSGVLTVAAHVYAPLSCGEPQ